MLELVDSFFVNMYSLRVFGFVHKPGLMQKLADWPTARNMHQENALLLAICALGAKFCALHHCSESQLANGLGISAGNQWARKAQQFVFQSMNDLSVEATMAVVLLHEHELRVGNYANGFLLTGLAVRMAQALQIGMESSPDVLCLQSQTLSATQKESRRRLMWSIFVMDSWVGSGVDELTLIDEADVRIQVPCSDASFEAGKACLVETLQRGNYLSFLSPSTIAQGPVENPDIHGHFLRLISLRRKVLR